MCILVLKCLGGVDVEFFVYFGVKFGCVCVCVYVDYVVQFWFFVLKLCDVFVFRDYLVKIYICMFVLCVKKLRGVV